MPERAPRSRVVATSGRLLHPRGMKHERYAAGSGEERPEEPHGSPCGEGFLSRGARIRTGDLLSEPTSCNETQRVESACKSGVRVRESPVTSCNEWKQARTRTVRAADRVAVCASIGREGASAGRLARAGRRAASRGRIRLGRVAGTVRRRVDRASRPPNRQGRARATPGAAQAGPPGRRRARRTLRFHRAWLASSGTRRSQRGAPRPPFDRGARARRRHRARAGHGACSPLKARPPPGAGQRLPSASPVLRTARSSLRRGPSAAPSRTLS